MVKGKSNNVRERVCPICNGKFMGRAAMRQHLLTKHGLGEPKKLVPPSPRVQPKVKVGASSTSRTVSGRDIIATVSVSDKSNVGYTVIRAALNPRLLRRTRLYQESRLWSRWRPTRLMCQLRTSAATVYGGSYIVAWSPDPSIQLETGSTAVQQLATFTSTAERSLYTPVTLNIPCDPNRKWYTFDTHDSSDSDHGVFFVVLSAPMLGFKGYVQFTMHLDWQVQFDAPLLDIDASADVFIYADAGYGPYFSDSSSDWFGGKYLTLKHKEGGSIVPFSEARIKTVYECTVDIPYVDTAGASQKTRYGSVAQNYTGYHILALFKDRSSAEAYAQTGDEKHLLTYYTPGGWVGSDNPAWKMLRSFKVEIGWTNSIEPACSLGVAAIHGNEGENNISELSRLIDVITSLERRLTLLEQPMMLGDAHDSGSCSSLEILPAPPPNGLPPPSC